MWRQRAARRPGAPIVWDYHVILLAGPPWEVWDLDTTLGLPIQASDYLRASFPPSIPEGLLPWFRLVEASEFIAQFTSDRSHMRRPDGEFVEPPPPWPPIGAKGRASNLMRFIDMKEAYIGEILRLDELLARVLEG